MTEAELLTAYIEDKHRQSEDQYRMTYTGFFSFAERSAAAAFCKKQKLRHAFYGGYPDAERAVLFLLPDYMEADETFTPDEEENPLCLLACRHAAGARPLSHRDYLGSLLALGVKRDVVGDILVHEGGASIIILRSIADFLLSGYHAAGNVPLTCTVSDIGALIPPEKHTEIIRESIASARLDNVLGAAFGISRQDAASAIAHGLVFVGDSEAKKPDARITPGDKLVLRGAGKAVFLEICGTTRKGRLSVLIEKYI